LPDTAATAIPCHCEIGDLHCLGELGVVGKGGTERDKPTDRIMLERYEAALGRGSLADILERARVAKPGR
jgi:hypothetical protein